MTRVLVFGGAENGRIFAPAEQTTSRQDGWVMVQLEDAGILKILTQGAAAFADDGDALRKVIAQAIRSGKYHHIVAGLLVEDGTKWTPAAAEQNAEFFAEITDADEKKQIAATFEGLLRGFFQNAVQSSMPSTTASTATEAVATKPTKRGRRSTATRAAVGPTARDGSQTATATA